MLRNAFGLTGFLIAVVGVGLLIAGVIVGGEALAGLGATGGFMLLFGAIFMGVGKRLGRVVMRGKDVLEHGIPGTGTVLEMSETGMTVNQQPVFGYKMAVEVDGLRAFETIVKQVTPRMLAGAVLPGAVLSIKVDPENHDEVVIDWSQPPQLGGGAMQPMVAEMGTPGAEAAVAAMADAGFQASGQVTLAEDLLRTGRRGTAVLTSVSDIGAVGELGLDKGDRELVHDRVYVIGMEVKLPGREPYPAQVAHRVPDRLIGRIGPGLEVQVAVDRADEARGVAIDWDASSL